MMSFEHANHSRILALKLSTLAHDDYQWLQGHVPEHAWQTLHPLVAEIRQLKFGLTYAELVALLTLNSQHDAARQKSQLERINDLQWQDVLRLFNQETDSLLPLFSSLHDWQWKNGPKFIAFRKRLSHQFGDHWVDRPLLKEALLSIVGDALRTTAHSVPPATTRRWSTVRHTLMAAMRWCKVFRREQPLKVER